MNSLYSQDAALAHGHSGKPTDGEPLDMSNGNPTARKSSAPESTMDTSTTPRSTAISEHSSFKSLDSIEAWLTSLRADHPVKDSQLPENDSEQPTSEICGPQQSSAFAWYDPNVSLWKTYQGSLLADTSHESLEIFPKSGIAHDGQLYPLPTLAHSTGANASGLWPTVRSHEAGDYQYSRGDKSKPVDTLTGAVKRAELIVAPSGPRNQIPAKEIWVEAAIQMVIKELQDEFGPLSVDTVNHGPLWPTPNQRGFCNEGDLEALARMTDDRDEFSGMAYRAGEKKKGEHWPTPRASEYKGTGPLGSKPHEHMLDKGYLGATVQEREQVAGQLNADWVEWLMNWPIGWSDLAPLPELRLEPIDVEPDIPRVVEGQKNRAKRLKALGNGWVPACAVKAWEILNQL